MTKTIERACTEWIESPCNNTMDRLFASLSDYAYWTSLIGETDYDLLAGLGEFRAAHYYGFTAYIAALKTILNLTPPRGLRRC